MSREMAEAFVRNLKLFNAKERDHLMRFAYLGENERYLQSPTFLSSAADESLRKHALEMLQMDLDGKVECVFAGMDYHLDWLFAALWIAKTFPSWSGKQESLPPSQPMASHDEVAGLKQLYTDFRSLNGSQEDVDLLVVYDDGTKLAVLFIEAKGSATFDRVQLARKVIRLDRILVDSGMTSQDDRLLEFRLILAAPKDYQPEFECCIKHARGLPSPKAGESDKFKPMRDALEHVEHRSGIGKDLHFIELAGFPKKTFAVERERKGADLQGRDSGAFTHWALKARK